MTALSVNLNKIALLRNARGRGYPDVAEFAHRTLQQGAAGITVHPRPDQRHATDADVATLRPLVDTYQAELNVEGRPEGRFLEVVLAARPQQCTLVPDAAGQRTSDHGYNLARDGAQLKPIIQQLQSAGIRVAIFMDADAEQMPLAKACGADRVELYTEAYASAYTQKTALEPVLQRYIDAAQAALDSGLKVNAGHDLDLDNLSLFLQRVPQVAEVSIGHALTVEALSMGWQSVVQRYLDICRQAAANTNNANT